MAYTPLDIDQSMAPVDGHYTSSFGWREYPLGDGVEKDFHYGVDISADEGTPVAAFADGVVDFVGESPSYGNYLEVRHSDTVTSRYAHCSKILVQEGDTVAMGDVIARSGSTGNVTGPHLHFEIRVNGLYHDPTYYLSLSQ